MFCPNCGKQLADGANFCTGCGTKLNLDFNAEEVSKPVEEPAASETGYEEQYDNYQEEPGYYEDGIDEYYEDAPAPKSGKKKLFIILAIVIAAAIAAILCVYFFVIKGKSSGSLETAAEKTSVALMERSEVTAFMHKAQETGKFGIDIKADNIGEMLSSFNSYLAFVKIGGEVSVAADKDGNAHVAVDVEALGQEIKAGLYSTADGDMEIIAAAPSILKDAYGVSLGTIEKDLDKSIFSPDSDSYYALDDYTYEQITSALGMVDAARNSIRPEDIEQLQKDLEENEDTKIEFEKTSDVVDVGDAEVKCDIYTAEIDAEKIANIVEFTGEWLEDNEAFSKYIETIAQMSGGMYGGDMPSMSELMKEAVDQIEDMDLDGTVEYDVYKGYLVRAAGSFKVEGEKIKFDITFGSDPANTDEIKATFKLPYNTVEITADLSKADDNEITVEVEEKEEDIYFKFNFKYDEEDKTFVATAKNAYRDFKVTGDMEITEDEVTIGDLKFSEDGEELLRLKGITITFSRNPVIRTAKGDFEDGYKNILSLSEDEFEDLIDEAQDTVYSLAG